MTFFINKKSFLAPAIYLLSSSIHPMVTSIPEEFWKTVETIAVAAPTGATSMAKIWPNESLLASAADSKDARQIQGGSFSISKDIQAKSSEIRISDNDKVKLIILRIDGMCITPADVKNRYPIHKNDDFPQPNNPDPVSYKVVQIRDVEVSFGFQSRLPRCLTHVVFDPAPR